jgi:acyl-ACP thioesterase
MKEKYKHTINYNEVDLNLNLRIDTLFSFLQYAAVTHSENRGAGTKYLLNQGYSWVLGKLEIDIDFFPKLNDKIDIYTWSLGSNGFIATRDFELKIDNKSFAKATSLWYFIDIEKKRPIKVPFDIMQKYNSLHIAPFFPELKKKKFRFPEKGTYNENITLRYSDFDSNSHVNNTAYFSFLQTALFHFKGYLPQIKNISCQFVKEIKDDHKFVNIAISQDKEVGMFKIYDDVDFCIGSFKIK